MNSRETIFLSKTINIFGQFGAHFHINLKTWMVSIRVAQERNKGVCYQCGYGIGLVPESWNGSGAGEGGAS